MAVKGLLGFFAGRYRLGSSKFPLFTHTHKKEQIRNMKFITLSEQNDMQLVLCIHVIIEDSWFRKITIKLINNMVLICSNLLRC